MAKKRLGEITEDLQKMDRAAGVAAEHLSTEIESCQKAIDYCLKTAWSAAHEDHPESRMEMFETAGKLMLASAGLASALARLKGEFHQHITVNHGTPAKDGNGNAPSTEEGAKREIYPRAVAGAAAPVQGARPGGRG